MENQELDLTNIPEEPSKLSILLYTGQARERTVEEVVMTAWPSVEILPKTSPEETSQAWYRLWVNESGENRYASGMRADFTEDDFTGFDPIIIYRALLLLDRFDSIADPFKDLSATSAIASGTVTRKQYQHFLGRVSPFLDQVDIRSIRRAIPENLDEVIDALQTYEIPIDGTTIEREIKRKKIEPSGLYGKIIEETMQRRADEEERFIDSRLGALTG